MISESRPRPDNLITSSLTPGLILGLIALAVPLWGSGCATTDPLELELASDWASGPNQLRNGAEEMTLDTTIVDNVSIDRGDQTDWKYFTVPASGVVAVQVTFDNAGAKGEIVVTDELGKIIATFEDEKRRLLDKVTFKANPGRYYVQVVVQSEDSDYSLQADYAPLLPGD